MKQQNQEQAAVLSVAIVEDDEWVRTNVAGEINAAPGLRCVEAFGSAEKALDAIPALSPDVVLMDIHLPGITGIECVRRLKGTCPGTQFLMLTMFEDSENIFNALLVGASGYLLKRTGTTELLEAIRQVHEGGAPMSSNIARRIVSHFNSLGARRSDVEKLGQREREVLEQLAGGLSYKEIADRLSLSIETIRMNVKHIYGKLHVHSRGEAVAKFMKMR